MRVGLFGGSFNPPHVGHLKSLETVLKKLGFDQINILPNAQNPLKKPTDGPTPEQRLEMVKLAITGYGSQLSVDDQEIKRGGLSYTINTIREYRKNTAAEDLFLIMGIDAFHGFTSWKDWQEIIKEANLVVTTRPGGDLPQSKEDFPELLQNYIEEFDFNFVQLKTERNIQFVTLKDVEVSATDVRKQLRAGRYPEKDLPLAVENYIRENKLYQPLGDRIGDYKEFATFCANVLFSRKGILVRAYDLRQMSAPTEFTVITSGTSTRHASAMAEQVISQVKQEYGVLPQSIEGIDEGRWVLLDYGSLIVHVFYDFVRNEYALEKLWKDGIDLGLKDPDEAKKP